MDTIVEMLVTRAEHLYDRMSGPLNFRLVVMPVVVSVLAIRAHLKDVREGMVTSLWVFPRDPAARRHLFRSGLKDFGGVFIVACVLDTIYQIMSLHAVYPGELLLVAVICALVPYFLARGPLMHIALMIYRKWTHPEPNKMKPWTRFSR